MPEATISEICDDMVDKENHREQAVALGLLESSEVYGDTSYRVPRILAKLLPRKQRPALLIQKVANSCIKLERSKVESKAKSSLWRYID